jgi:tetratricopeptide (TPR) repeat protein
MARENLGDRYEAMEDFDRAIELNSGYIDAYFRRAIVKEHLGDYTGALADFDRVLEIDPESENKVMKMRDRTATLLKEAQTSLNP